MNKLTNISYLRKRIYFFFQNLKFRRYFDKKDVLHRFIAIYKTEFIKTEIESLYYENTEIKISRKRRKFVIPYYTKIITSPYSFNNFNSYKKKTRLKILKTGFDGNSYIYISVSIAPSPSGTKELSYLELSNLINQYFGKAIVSLSLIFDTNSLFSDLIYKGPILVNPKYFNNIKEIHLGEYFTFSKRF